MLTELLEVLKNGGTLEVNQLAKRFNTTPTMISMMIEHMQKSARIKKYETCHNGCADCSLASLCIKSTDERASKVWQFEEAGE